MKKLRLKKEIIQNLDILRFVAVIILQLVP